MKIVQKKGAVTLAKGFTASAIAVGIKYKDRDDLALLFSGKKARAAAVFTTNKVKAWPVLMGMDSIREPYMRAVIVNSGNANCANGLVNEAKTAEYCCKVAGLLGIKPIEVVPSSTGVIGRDLPTEKIMKKLPELVENLSSKNGGKAAKAILTTDTRTKEYAVSFEIGGKKVNIGVMAKGSGMLHPNMATMLVYFTTDLNISKALLKRALKNVSAKTFNRICVDNDMSTNDTVLIMANGAAENDLIKKADKDYQKFETALYELARRTAKELVSDGEGVEKVCTINVSGGRTEKEAEKAGRALATSMLFKTALHGADPNWGRIVSAIGSYEDITCKFEKMTIKIGGNTVYANGTPDEKALSKAAKAMKKKEVILDVDLASGKAEAEFITSDLTREYITINADYTT